MNVIYNIQCKHNSKVPFIFTQNYRLKFNFFNILWFLQYKRESIENKEKKFIVKKTYFVCNYAHIILQDTSKEKVKEHCVNFIPTLFLNLMKLRNLKISCLSSFFNLTKLCYWSSENSVSQTSVSRCILLPCLQVLFLLRETPGFCVSAQCGEVSSGTTWALRVPMSLLHIIFLGALLARYIARWCHWAETRHAPVAI